MPIFATQTSKIIVGIVIVDIDGIALAFCAFRLNVLEIVWLR